MNRVGGFDLNRG